MRIQENAAESGTCEYWKEKRAYANERCHGNRTWPDWRRLSWADAPATSIRGAPHSIYANCMQIVCKLYANETQPACLMTPVTICICLQSFITGRISITEHLVFLQESHWESLDGNMQMSQRHSAVEAFHQNKPRVDSENLQKPLGGREGGEFQESEPSPWRILQQQPEKERNGREICKLGRGKALKRANGKNIQVHLGPINPNQSQSIQIAHIWNMNFAEEDIHGHSFRQSFRPERHGFNTISSHFLPFSCNEWFELPLGGAARVAPPFPLAFPLNSTFQMKCQVKEKWTLKRQLGAPFQCVYTSKCDVHSAPFRPIQLVNLFKYSPE